MRGRRPAEFILAVLILVGCAGIRFDGAFVSSDSDWETLGGSAKRTHRTRVEVPPPLRIAWTYNTQGGVLAHPLVRDSVVIVGTLHGELQLVSIADGKRLGYVSLGGPLRGTPALNGLNVIVTASSGESSVLSYGLREGRTSWKMSLGPVESSPLLLDGKVYVSTLAGEIFCIDAANGEERWRFAPGSEESRKPFRSSPASIGGILACGNDDGIVYAVRVSDGSPAWSVRTGGPIFSTPAVVDDRVIITNLAGEVTALDLRSGSVHWSFGLGAPLYASPASDGSHVFIASSDGSVRSIRLSDGGVQWKWEGDGVLNSAPLVSDHYLYFGSLNRQFTVLEKGMGTLAWSMPIQGRMKVTPVAWNDYLLLVFEDRTLLALKARVE